MDFRTKRNKLALGISTALLSVGLSSTVFASSHREAPQITRTPTVDATDFYAFMDYSGESGTEDKVILVANYYPLQDAYGGPNYFTMDPNAIYEIHIDNDGDAVEDITFQFKFDQKLGSQSLCNLSESDVSKNGVELQIGSGENARCVDIPLKNFGNIPNDDSVNFVENYTLTMIKGDRRDGNKIPLTNRETNTQSFAKPFDNIGVKSFSSENGALKNYEEYANTFIHDFNIDGCMAGDSKVFVGQRKDPFVVNLGETFDLVNYVPLESAGYGSVSDGPNDLADKNVTTFALSIDKSCLLGDSDVIGAWTTASLQQGRILNPKATFAKPEVNGGAYTQVSRLGMPLVNEVIIGLSNKDKFNASEPKDDGQFLKYVLNPTLPALLDILFRDALSAPSDIAPSNIPRTDLEIAFLKGFPNVNQLSTVTPSEMLRLNTALPATDSALQEELGLVTGDLAGFPNGRRPVDDVVDIALRVSMGALCHPVNLDLDDNGSVETGGENLGICDPEDAPVGDKPFTDRAPTEIDDLRPNFPFLATPLAGSKI